MNPAERQRTLRPDCGEVDSALIAVLFRQTMTTMECACSCGATKFKTLARPLFRIYCHCTLCQRFHNAPFADILVHAAGDVELPPAEIVDFQTYKPPPNVQRGRCATCGQPAIALFDAPILPRLVMVPSAMVRPDALIPTPIAHIFYDKRLMDIEDSYPKHQGYLRSQAAFLKYVYTARQC